MRSLVDEGVTARWESGKGRTCSGRLRHANLADLPVDEHVRRLHVVPLLAHKRIRPAAIRWLTRTRYLIDREKPKRERTNDRKKFIQALLRPLLSCLKLLVLSDGHSSQGTPLFVFPADGRSTGSARDETV